MSLSACHAGIGPATADMKTRSTALRQQGYRDLAFAVATALLALGSDGSGIALLGCVLAAWLAFRGHLFVQHSDPLSDSERRELERLRGGSRTVRQALDALKATGAEPVRFDLLKCRQLARLEAKAG